MYLSSHISKCHLFHFSLVRNLISLKPDLSFFFTNNKVIISMLENFVPYQNITCQISLICFLMGTKWNSCSSSKQINRKEKTSVAYFAKRQIWWYDYIWLTFLFSTLHLDFLSKWMIQDGNKIKKYPQINSK